jgi:hypothetical protein
MLVKGIAMLRTAAFGSHGGLPPLEKAQLVDRGVCAFLIIVFLEALLPWQGCLHHRPPIPLSLRDGS